MNKAAEKIEKEIADYRKKTTAMKTDQVYRFAGQITYTEATAYYTKQLIEADENLVALVLNDGKTLIDCVQHVMGEDQKKYGNCGDMPVDEFHRFIWNYYEMPAETASTAIKAADEKRKAQQQAAKKAKQAAHDKKAAESTQISLFDIKPPENPEKDDKTDVAETAAKQEEGAVNA